MGVQHYLATVGRPGRGIQKRDVLEKAGQRPTGNCMLPPARVRSFIGSGIAPAMSCPSVKGTKPLLSSLELDASTSPIVSKWTQDWKGSGLKMASLTSEAASALFGFVPSHRLGKVRSDDAPTIPGRAPPGP